MSANKETFIRNLETILNTNRIKQRKNCNNCHKCLEGEVTEIGIPVLITRMILCPDCGNKRCPKATDHELTCTNSNEPGQPGSNYK